MVSNPRKVIYKQVVAKMGLSLFKDGTRAHFYIQTGGLFMIDLMIGMPDTVGFHSRCRLGSPWKQSFFYIR